MNPALSLFLLGLYALGALVGRAALPRLPLALHLAAGWVYGFGLYVLAALFVLVVGVPYTGAVMLGLLATIGIAAGLAVARHTWSYGDSRLIVASVLLAAMTSFALASFNLSPMTSDSSGQVLMGRSLALYGGFDPELAGWPSVDMGWFANYGGYVAIVQSSALFIGADYHHAAAPALALSFLATLIVAYRRLLLNVAPRSGCVTHWAVLAVAAAGSAFMMAVQAFYIHNSLPAAAHLFWFVAAAWFGLVERELQWFRLAAVQLVLFAITRTEAPLFAVLFMLPVLAAPTLPYGSRCLLAGVLAGVVIPWYLRLYTITLPGYAYILTRPRIMTIVAVLAALALVSILSRMRFMQALLRRGPALAIGATALAFCVAVALRPSHLSASAQSIVSNCLLTGSWQGLWWSLMTLLILAAALPRVRFQALISASGLSFFLFMVVLSCFKNPYRLGWSDSANRMLVMLVPLLLFYCLMRYGRAAEAVTRGHAWLRARSWRAPLPGIAAVALLVLAGVRPINYALDARVVAGPACAPGYGFDVALRGLSGFVSVVDRCPVDVFFDLGRTCSADMLEIEMHDYNRRLTDFAWHASTDGRDWTEVYDSRSPDPRRSRLAAPATALVRLDRTGPLRYLRLSARAAADENRILLNRLAIWSSYPDLKWNEARAFEALAAPALPATQLAPPPESPAAP